MTSTTTNELPFPPAASVKGRVLGALLRGERLTHADCWARFGSSRLSHHTFKLRAIGWPVQMVERPVRTCDAGRKARIGVYFLDSECVAKAGERGQEYARYCSRIEAERRAT